MRKSLIILACAFSCLLAQNAFAAVKYMRFAHCPEGLVTANTCECHVGTSGRYHYCHAGHYCHFDGACTK